MEKLALIVNPVAGDGKCIRKLPNVEQILKNNAINYTTFLTKRPGQAADLAQSAAQQGYTTIVAMGGDGTLNEVVNGLLASSTDATLGVISAGSGNDFGRTFGLRSGDIQQACSVILAGQTRMIDIGQTNGKYFINVAGAGFDAEVGRMANVWGKRYFSGYMAYIASMLRQLISYKPQLMDIELDGKSMQVKAWLVAVANAKYFGAGMMIAPTAIADDRQFDVYVIQETSKLELLKVLPKVFDGSHVTHKAVTCYTASVVKLKSASSMAVQADGEILGALPSEFRIAPQRLRVLLP